MTLIVGIKCSDGVVLGADGAATLGAMGDHTIRQPTRHKIDVIAGCVALGCSGPVGLAQRIHGEVDALWNGHKVKGEPFQIMKILRDAVWNVVENEWKVATATRGVVGPQLAANSATVYTLVALPMKREMFLFSFDHQGAPEQATDDLPFVAIGSGQRIADPFLAFIRRIFWPDRPPTLVEGVFAALWCLDHAIQTNPGGVSDPKQIVVLERQGGDCRIRELQEGDLTEHYEAIKAAEGSLRGFRDTLNPGKPGAPAPEPPPDVTPPAVSAR